MALKRAAFCFLRLRALGFSNRRCSRTCCKVCARSSFFLSRRKALSTGSPFRSLISDIPEQELVSQQILARLFAFGRPVAQAMAADFSLCRLASAGHGGGYCLAQIKIPPPPSPLSARTPKPRLTL